MVKSAGTRERGHHRVQDRGDGGVVSAVDVVVGLWGGVVAVDKATGTTEASSLHTSQVDERWVTVVVEAMGWVEGPPPLTADGSPPWLMPLDKGGVTAVE